MATFWAAAVPASSAATNADLIIRGVGLGCEKRRAPAQMKKRLGVTFIPLVRGTACQKVRYTGRHDCCRGHRTREVICMR